MPTVGPQLSPSLLEKRRRDDDEDQNDSDHKERCGSFSPDNTSKRQRTIGPTLPPAPLDERPPSPPIDPTKAVTPDSHEGGTSSDDDNDDDGFGPALPDTADAQTPSTSSNPTTAPSTAPPPSTAARPSQRDAWMLVPPTSGDWTARVDPTKLKARKFNTSKAASHPSSRDSGGADTWNETPEQKQARLQREIMGINDPNSIRSKTSSAGSKTERESAEDAETRRRLKEYNASRGPSLYEAHHQKHQVEKDDDPSARAFDREKDIAGGLQINSTQRRDMMKKAGDFGSRFSSGKYL